MKKSILIIIALFSITACMLQAPLVRNISIDDQPAVRNTAITFSGYYMPPTKAPQFTNPVTEKNNYRFRIVSRELLDTDSSETPVFGYYVYLIFTDQSEVTYPLRKAAAMAFMCQFEEPEQSRIVGLNTKNNAVFYAPIKPGAAPSIKKYRSGDTLLDNYDYHFAQTLINRIGEYNTLKTFEVGIVAHSFAHESKTFNPTMFDDFEVIDLSNMTPAKIGAVIRKLRQAVLDPSHITAFRVPENAETVNSPLFVDVTVDNFSAIFSATLKSIISLSPQIETAEAASIKCN